MRQAAQGSVRSTISACSSQPGKPTREQKMTITVKVGEAKTHLSELLAKVEAGEDIIIARGNDPIARLSRIPRNDDMDALIEEVRAARARAKPVTTEEILAWRHEGHRH
jgi:antitoxin (DNA-binding transcriptional repressor) of toxin-antitoxin stability system